MAAKMVPFGGWEMPVQYSSILNEHLTTRKEAGLFDISHMGEILVEGKDAETFLEKMTCNLISDIKEGQVQYNAVVNEAGGLIDDVTIYKWNTNKYLICSNASNYEKVTGHLNKYRSGNVHIEDKSSTYHQLALQGPLADKILSQYLNKNLNSLGYYQFQEFDFQGENILVSRTGYTGEDGFEIYSSVNLGVKLWEELLQSGKPLGLIPVGLGARDTLRLEAKYPLYGHELSEEWTPVESGIGFFVKEKPLPFLGYDKILSHKKNKPLQKIVGLVLEEPGIFRENCSVCGEDGMLLGKTTSGSHSPSRKDSIGLAMLKIEFTEKGTIVYVDIRGQKKRARVETAPFWVGSVRNKK